MKKWRFSHYLENFRHIFFFLSALEREHVGRSGGFRFFSLFPLASLLPSRNLSPLLLACQSATYTRTSTGKRGREKTGVGHVTTNDGKKKKKVPSRLVLPRHVSEYYITNTKCIESVNQCSEWVTTNGNNKHKTYSFHSYSSENQFFRQNIDIRLK